MLSMMKQSLIWKTDRLSLFFFDFFALWGHYEVTMSGALMANYYISWRLENIVTSSKYCIIKMHACMHA